MNDKPPKSPWGPWSPVLTDETERIAQLRCIRTLVHVLMNSRRAPDYTDTVKHLEIVLQVAEATSKTFGSPKIALENARLLFDAMPAARQRDIIATFAVLHKPLTPQKEG